MRCPNGSNRAASGCPRGSRSPSEDTTWIDAIIDATSDKIGWRGPGRVHGGFHAQYQSLVDPRTCEDANVELTFFLDQLHGEGGSAGPLYVTGHSLGGALATMFLADAQAATCGKQANCRKAPQFDIAALVTFGSPKVGNTTFANEVAWRAAGHTPIYRVVHQDDVVTGVPRNTNFGETLVSGDYEHLSYKNGSEATLQVWVTDDELSIGTDEIHLLHSFDDHAYDHYVAKVGMYARKRGELR